MSASPPFQPTLVVTPSAVDLPARATQVFRAATNYPEGVRMLRQPVSWSVLEPLGGSITAAGLYTAPDAAGVYHVRAQREDYLELVVTVAITVK